MPIDGRAFSITSTRYPSMAKVKRLLRKIFRKAHNDITDHTAAEPAPPTALPVLPLRRNYLLTPSPSRVDLNRISSPHGVFFQRLPRELRDEVYIAAFGGRTVHMHCHSEYPRSPHEALAVTSAAAIEQMDSDMPPRWARWNCVCHSYFQCALYDDRCRCGLPQKICNHFYAGRWPDQCSLGILGWLLSCRQAYVAILSRPIWHPHHNATTFSRHTTFP